MTRASRPPTDHLLNRLRNFAYFRLRYPWVRRGRNVHVQWSTRMWSPHRNIEIGDDVGIGFDCLFQCDVKIGSHVLIASNVALVAADAHSVDRPGSYIWGAPGAWASPVVIDDDVWIGHGAIVLSGVRIGRGAIVAAGAVVTEDVAPYSIVSSPKATHLRYRFDEEGRRIHDAMIDRPERSGR
jgi:acetyltransferase-like isoleucine patch superfamily enzyme